ncbi:hypothetical protein [Sinanaerobacter chloroacetimidivorans]|uniref:Uncharacterized protein n=1 Tax=Sinanaerobacter chloroacetimidivorans TaxID=2818044 RepID=A0A8J7W1S2_9FIRM|nr:hypothetical protein [Sinanaerobacter chloroacetimidivorans]MBR0597630.1 hypothetical protein [Sinanaerobacter chloroacetimidivorans]
MKCQERELITLPVDEGFSFTYEQMNINNTFQKLWFLLAVFMRNYIYAVMLNLPSEEAVAERLYQVPADFRNALQIFYGTEIAGMFNNMFTNFLTKPASIMEGMKTNNQELVNQGTQEWYQTAGEIAAFLDRINLFWDENQWRYLLNQYISLNIEMILAIATGDYRKEIQIYERIFDLTSIMGTYMARGIIARELQRSS